jgi:hypothetical protein
MNKLIQCLHVVLQFHVKNHEKWDIFSNLWFLLYNQSIILFIKLWNKSYFVTILNNKNIWTHTYTYEKKLKEKNWMLKNDVIKLFLNIFNLCGCPIFFTHICWSRVQRVQKSRPPPALRVQMVSQCIRWHLWYPK